MYVISRVLQQKNILLDEMCFFLFFKYAAVRSLVPPRHHTHTRGGGGWLTWTESLTRSWDGVQGTHFFSWDELTFSGDAVVVLLSCFYMHILIWRYYEPKKRNTQCSASMAKKKLSYLLFFSLISMVSLAFSPFYVCTIHAHGEGFSLLLFLSWAPL